MSRRAIPLSEFVILGLAAVLLAGFAALPWTEAYFDRTLHTGVSGLRLALAGPDVRLLKETDHISGTEDEGFIRYQGRNRQLTPLRLLPYLGLFLIPLAALGGSGVTLRAMRHPLHRREAIRQRRILAGLVILYFVLVYPGYAVSGLGIWVCGVSALVLLIVAPADNGIWAPWKLDFSKF
jgi:hypothetical protein